MISVDAVYGELVEKIINDGETVTTRNATCKRIFAEKIVFRSTPLVGVRRTAWKNALREWEWFMSGSEDVNDLHPSVRSWWEPWATKGHEFLEDGVVNFNYSYQFRRFDGTSGYAVDQIALLIDGIKNHPFSRRNVATTWNPKDMTSEFCTITNCHGTVIQAFVDGANRLHLVTYQRSADVVCGLPHNWIQYWAFLLWLAHRGDRDVGTLTWVGGDIHLYDAHHELADKIVRTCTSYALKPTPELVYSRPDGEPEFKADHFAIAGNYMPLCEDRAEMIV